MACGVLSAGPADETMSQVRVGMSKGAGVASALVTFARTAPSQLGGINENQLCQLPGANYDNLTRGTDNPGVELPDQPPLFR